MPAITAIFTGSHPSIAFCSDPNSHMKTQKPTIETMLFVIGAHAYGANTRRALSVSPMSANMP